MLSSILFATLASITGANAATFNIASTGSSPAPFQNAPTAATVGDILNFDLGAAGLHSIVDVTSDQYAACTVNDATPPVLGLTSNGLVASFSYTLTTPGTYYIVCPVHDGAHCRFGMKFALTVAPAPAAAAGTTAAAPTVIAAPAQTTTVVAATTTSKAAATTVAATTSKSSADSVFLSMGSLLAAALLA
ncbi:hypothetical protein BDR26DRAFT_917578 [Obelidium mucronatum]|nr:hypothetical protein BDR26DRAFT_917578 [Obelidium mucronatum]